MLLFSEKVHYAIITCLTRHQHASISIIRSYVGDSLPDARVEDVNAGLVDLIEQGDVETFMLGFKLRKI